MRRTALAVFAVLVASVATPTHAAAPSRPAGQPPAVTQVRTVHLITGDTVLVTTLANGSRVARITAGPHADGPVAHATVASASYLVPRLPAALRSKLDPSLYDVARLEQLPADRVPVVVTLRDDGAPRARRAAGDALDLRRTPSGTVLGSYPAAGVDAADLAAVRSVRLAGPAHPALAPALATRARHRLTVEIHSGTGTPAAYADVLLAAVDDPGGFGDFLQTGADGTVTVRVPAGRYALVASTASALLLPPEVQVTEDRTVSLDLADASVRPHVSMPGHRVAEASLGVSGQIGDSTAFGFGYTGRHFFTRLQPTPAEQSYGSVRSSVSTKLVRKGGGPVRDADRLVVTADFAAGIPADLTFVHHREEFARIVQEFYANGPAGRMPTFVDAMSPSGDASGSQVNPTPVPGRRVLLVQASRDVSYLQGVLLRAPSGHRGAATLLDIRRFPRAGHTYRTMFAHGPVGPGLEGSQPYPTVGRVGSRIYGYLPLLSGAGSSMTGLVAKPDGDWSLRRGDEVLAHGWSMVGFGLKAPRDRRPYVLRAVSHPTGGRWTLSTNVADEWTFHVSRGDGALPIITPSYVPPSTLAGYVGPGRTGFRLTFGTQVHDHRIDRATVELSTDGGDHWRPARVARTGAHTFRVRYGNPAAHGDRRTMSIRVTGHDRHGNAVVETAKDVYRLR